MRDGSYTTDDKALAVWLTLWTLGWVPFIAYTTISNDAGWIPLLVGVFAPFLFIAGAIVVFGLIGGCICLYVRLLNVKVVS